MILLREVKPADLDKLYALAQRLNTLNLPADRARLERLIARSQDSFSGQSASLKDREYVFVMIDPVPDKLIGTCMIIAQHGSFDRPSVYFDVRHDQKYSSTIKKHFIHQTLQLTFDYDGPTEVGGLILDPSYRNHPLRLGKILSFVRFLYIGMHRDWFRDSIVAELLPPLNPDGTSDLWNHIGANFTGLDYMMADKMSRENIEFVRSLFPHTALYTCMLPPEVRAQIGQVGPQTQPVERMLERVGFRYNHKIDPFDGGPTFEVATDECEPVVRTHMVTFAGLLPEDHPAEGAALVGFDLEDDPVRFRAAYGEYAMTPRGALLRATGFEKLRIHEGARIGLLPFSGPHLATL